MTDPIIQRIETFRCARGPLTAEKRNRGYTLYHAVSGQPVARLRFIPGKDDRVQVLYWSHWKEQWSQAGPLGRAALTIDRALELIAAEDTFWTEV